jgi:2-oxoglutarate dehydrogenase complex dehydrogenase (E1) component-like enzyme
MKEATGEKDLALDTDIFTLLQLVHAI